MTVDRPNRDQRRTVEIISALGFGVIERLTIRDGFPTYEPEPRIIQTIKLGSNAEPRSVPNSTCSTLKKEFQELFDQFGRLRDGTVNIEVRHSLPFRLVVERRPAELTLDSLSSSADVIA